MPSKAALKEAIAKLIQCFVRPEIDVIRKNQNAVLFILLVNNHF